MMLLRNHRVWLWGVILPLVGTLFFVGSAQAKGGVHWKQAGQSVENTRHQKTESKINADNVSELTTRWVTNTGGDVSATPAVDGEFIYFPDFGGNLYKVVAKTGEVVWQRQISSYAGVPGNFSRTTPAIKGDLLIFGDQGGRTGMNGGAHVMAINKDTGDRVWVTIVDPHYAAIITQSATVSGNVVYVGVSSFEEFLATSEAITCCSFRGSMLALEADTGAVIWQTYMAPMGFTGNAIWGSSPAVDRKRGQVYIATGNNYNAPQAFLNCVAAAGDDGSAQQACLAPYPDNYFDAVVALDLETGAVNWANSVVNYDVWTVACLFVQPTCPNPEGPGFDFGQAPMLYSTKIDGKKRDMLGVGQKSGTFWSLDPDTGEVVWATQVSPGGIIGGLMWGSSYDGDLIYTSSANSQYLPWILADGGTTKGGIWSALNPATGEIVWQTANPTGNNTAGGAVTSANGVVYVCSQDPSGYMYALDAPTGNVLWSFASGGSCNSGAAVVNGIVYWGSGYVGSGYAGFGPPNSPPNTANSQIYSFGLPD